MEAKPFRHRGLRPIINRKLRQSTTTVGCWLTKRVNGLEASSIKIIAITTAAIITGRWLTIPTAVITASEGEDGIQHHYLQYYYPETGIAFTVTGIVLAVFQPFMQLGCRLKQQEDPAEQHDEIAPGKGEIGDGNQWFRQRHHPRR